MSSPFVHTPTSLHYAITHVFLPVQLPDTNDYTLENDHSLARAVAAAAHAYGTYIRGTLEHDQWSLITKMLDNLQASVQSEQIDYNLVVSQLQGMGTGDILAYFIGPQNVAIIFTKQQSRTLCRAFEVSPSDVDIEEATGPLRRSYPASAVEIPNTVFNNNDVQAAFAEFLCCRNAVATDHRQLPPSAHPQYINALLDSILQSVGPHLTECMVSGIGRTPDVPAITKHVRDDVRRKEFSRDADSWRRSSLFLFVRVAIQLSVGHSLPGRTCYKGFMLFFMCTLARDGCNTNLLGLLLRFVSSRILQRVKKLGSSIPPWLSNLALEVCTGIREMLDARWEKLNTRPSPFQNPSKDILSKDTRISLPSSGEYIQNLLENSAPNTVCAPFHPCHRRRGTLEDFLSVDETFFDEAYDADPDATLYDVGRLVEQGIDDWLIRVTNVGEACAQLEALMDKYMVVGFQKWSGSPEDISNGLLTAVELYVALDKLVVNEIPMLAEYSPEVPVAALEDLLLRKSTSLHRLSCAYQYLSARHSQARPGWSVLSDEFTEDSFPVRYYDQSAHLQRLKACIEREYHQRRQSEKRLVDTADVSQSLLPALPLHAKFIVFELQCPARICIWRSAAARILYYFSRCLFARLQPTQEEERHLLAHFPALQPYFMKRQAPPLRFQIHFAYYYSEAQPRESTLLRYVMQHPSQWRVNQDSLSTWRPWKHYGNEYRSFSLSHKYGLPMELQGYVQSTSVTSNDVLATQANCPTDLTLDEFIAFAHLRSGGALQWLNILWGVRSRALNLRRHRVHFLISQAVFQVGPLDVNTGAWTWHQELQEPSFCNALLDELGVLFLDIGVTSIDGVLMYTISLLLTRMLMSSPNEFVLERAIGLLRNVHKKTFTWVQELSWDLAKAPTRKERSNLLLEMAATCRGIFGVDPATLPKFFSFAGEIDAMLSCAFFIHALRPERLSDSEHYLQLLLARDACFSLHAEGTLGKAILADVSNHGVDLAVAKIFASYQPSVYRWEQSGSPNDRWLACKTRMTTDNSSQKVHVNLLDGGLRVNGQLLVGLPQDAGPSLRKIFRDQGLFAVSSDLPGIDFMTLPLTSMHKVYFSLREDTLDVRMHNNETNDFFALVPSTKFLGDLPPALISGHIHWLNLSTKIIEIRPLEHVWEQSAENWRIDCGSGQYHVYKGRETLVDIHSPTWAMILKCFKCLNNVHGFAALSDDSDSDKEGKNLLVTVTSIQPAPSQQLSVTLLQYGLSFFVNEKEELESRDFKHMVYDENQCIGTLFAFESLLVLRPRTHPLGIPIPEELIHRRIIIPNALPVLNPRGHVARIDVDCTFPGQDKALYHTYNVDTDMGCLTGSGSLTSTHFLAYLHAITSCHRYDPLTGRMGTQVALDLLRSAGCQSIMERKTLDLYLPSSTLHPEINAAYREMKKRNYWEEENQQSGALSAQDERAVQRAARYLFPSNATGTTRPEEIESNSVAFKLFTPIEADLRPHTGPNPPESSPQHTITERSTKQISLDRLMRDRPAPELVSRSTLPRDSYGSMPPNDVAALDQLFQLSSFQTDPTFYREYLARLHASVGYLCVESQRTYKTTGENLLETLGEHYVKCRANYRDSLDILKKRLGPTTPTQVTDQCSQWPPITADVLLRCLASTLAVDIPPSWKRCLTSLAVLLLDLQRARRLFRFALDGLEEELEKELENEGCDGWNPEEYPDWLLIQIQGNFLIRRAQAETAMEMISPQSGENTVMQVNMGEGKSSVIIPIVAAALADGKQLVRVVVPKAMTAQMFELLVARLGGLANRPIYYLPFSRTPEYNHLAELITPQIDRLHGLILQCTTEHGILLVQPEQVASLKLTAVEQQMVYEGKRQINSLLKHQKLILKYIKTPLLFQSLRGDSHVANIFRLLGQSSNRSRANGNTQADRDGDHSGAAHGASDSASKWLNLQTWLHRHARDILDESDEILHARFQLVYTIGPQQHVDGSPDRWTVIQEVLRLVKNNVHSLSRYAPDSIEHERGPPGSFPHIHIVRASDVSRYLVSLITEDVMAGQLPGFHFQHISPELYDAIRNFISDESVFQIPDTVKRVEEYAKASNQSHLWGGLLLLRGLLTSNTLLFALAEQRWRVNYGLWQPQPRHSWRSPTPTMLAVPYRAKDMPAHNSQFGHPDLTIILTYLSYYYSGLSEEQLRVAFEILLDQDAPYMEYVLWLKEYDHEPLPDPLRNLSDINLRTSEQWDNIIFPLFSRNQATINFYLARVVFPKEAKEFPWKLSASSWDLSEKRENPITGFSGTNDGRWLLPMSVIQHDLSHQRGTNARVLASLLQPENDFYMVTHENGERQTTLRFLRLVTSQKPEIRVLLDVGAQILDLSNRQVAEAWIDIACGEPAGAVYFDEHDELVVLTPNGVIQPLSSSSLSQQLSTCLVYLDHAHTRGTDIKLPAGSRAAVTLGQKVTKDALVQGCMRMRKLGRGHSVMFFATLGVDLSIRTVNGNSDPNSRVTTVHVLRWAMHQTWTDIKQRVPYWAKQGMDHKTRYDAWSRFCQNDLTREQLSEAWLQPDLKSLVDLYAPREHKSMQHDLSLLDSGIRQRCKDIGVLSLPTARMDEEHEREVNREREREREVELPPRAEPAEHFLHPDVVTFVRTGMLPPRHSGGGFLPVFTTLENSSAATSEADVWSPFILATADFCRTIKPESTPGTMDQYLRPVQWILSSRNSPDRPRVLVLLSPFEADLLLPDIRQSERVYLHLYAPCTSQRMKPSDDLGLYSIPPLPSDWTPPWALIDQLNVFAGQLYLRDYPTYLRLCYFLGVPTKASSSKTAVRRNLFNVPGSFEEIEITFSASPLPSVMALLAIRSRGKPFSETHMGKILQGKMLTERDFEEPTRQHRGSSTMH